MRSTRLLICLLVLPAHDLSISDGIVRAQPKGSRAQQINQSVDFEHTARKTCKSTDLEQVAQQKTGASGSTKREQNDKKELKPNSPAPSA